jgi:hypothetical protein
VARRQLDEILGQSAATQVHFEYTLFSPWYPVNVASLDVSWRCCMLNSTEVNCPSGDDGFSFSTRQSAEF